MPTKDEYQDNLDAVELKIARAEAGEEQDLPLEQLYKVRTGLQRRVHDREHVRPT